jgi:hypothetical protein
MSGLSPSPVGLKPFPLPSDTRFLIKPSKFQLLLDTFQLHLLLEYLDRFFNVVSNLYTNGHQNPFFILTLLILAHERQGYLRKKPIEAKKKGL